MTKQTSFLIFFAFLISLPVSAQDRLPSIQDFTSELKEENISIPERRNSSIRNNQYLQDKLDLQYQISLLESMIERQSSVSLLQRNYIELGIAFEQPNPPKGICEQIPANVPCARAYPELYDLDFPTFAPPPEIIEEVVEEAPIVPEPEIIIEREPESLAVQYAWTNVSCGGGTCSAVLTKPGGNFRRTVKVGDTLEDGKITVTNISLNGVSVEERNIKIELRAALSPEDGGPVSTRLGSPEPISNRPSVRTQSLNAQASAPSPSSGQLPEVTNNEPIQDPGPPPLGPTGLF